MVAKSDGKKRSPANWFGNLLLVWLPGLLYVAFFVLTRQARDAWLVIFVILPLYFVAIYLLKRQKPPKETKPVYKSAGAGYAVFFLLCALFVIAVSAYVLTVRQVGSAEAFSIMLFCYIFVPLLAVFYRMASYGRKSA
jgi:FtsH-binding integral membrane protein